MQCFQMDRTNQKHMHVLRARGEVDVRNNIAVAKALVSEKQRPHAEKTSTLIIRRHMLSY